MSITATRFATQIRTLAASGARPVRPGEIPELEAAVEDLAHRAGVPVP